jgi:sortase A
MSYKRANGVLLVLIVIVNGYIIAAPLWPKLAVWWQLQHTGIRQQLTTQIHQPLSPTSSAPATVNHVVIPDMALNQPIYDGSVAATYKVLARGIWRWPRGSHPGQPGNSVLIGHRFTYTNPRGVFYALDKVRLGSEIAVYWNNHEYLYRVTSINVVPANDTAIEAQTSDTRLTLYTCTPLWHPINRLVVVATPEGLTA